MFKSLLEKWLGKPSKGGNGEQSGGQGNGEQSEGRDKGEQRVGRKEANASSVNRQGVNLAPSFWTLLEKEKLTKYAILYGQKV